MLPSKHSLKLNLEHVRVINDAMWIHLSFPLCNIEINFMFGQIFDTTERKNGQNNDEKISHMGVHVPGLVQRNMG